MAWETFPYSYTSPYIRSWIFETLQVIIFWVRVTHKKLNVNSSTWITHPTHPYITHPTPPLDDPPYHTPAWCTPPLYDTSHLPCKTPHPTSTWPTPPHPCMTHPTPPYLYMTHPTPPHPFMIHPPHPTPPLHDTPTPYFMTHPPHPTSPHPFMTHPPQPTPQPQNKGPGMLWGQSYVLPMTCRGVEALGPPFGRHAALRLFHFICWTHPKFLSINRSRFTYTCRFDKSGGT